jgi:hypothetical protein
MLMSVLATNWPSIRVWTAQRWSFSRNGSQDERLFLPA